MNHAITIGGLLSVLAIIAGFGVLAFGILMMGAAGMSDAPDDGTGGTGCTVFLVGAALLGLGLWGLLA